MENKEIYCAIIQAQSKINAIEKGSKAGSGSFSFNYADLASVIISIRPVLAECKLGFMQKIEKNCIVTIIIHESGQSIESCTDITSFMSDSGKSNMNSVQKFGSAITYVKRYSLVSIFGIATVDDDGLGSTQETPVKTEKKVEPKKENQDEKKNDTKVPTVPHVLAYYEFKKGTIELFKDNVEKYEKALRTLTELCYQFELHKIPQKSVEPLMNLPVNESIKFMEEYLKIPL